MSRRIDSIGVKCVYRGMVGTVIERIGPNVFFATPHGTLVFTEITDFRQGAKWPTPEQEDQQLHMEQASMKLSGLDEAYMLTEEALALIGRYRKEGQ